MLGWVNIGTVAGRRPILSVIGYGGQIESPIEQLCVELGRGAVDAGWRLVTGGLGGVMAAVSQGARGSPAWREGDVIGILPSYDRTTANAWVDIAVPTGMQMGRNILVAAMADVVVAVGGGAGTLSEIALAWQLGKPIIGLRTAGGWGAVLAGTCVDERHDLPIQAVDSVAEALACAQALRAHDPREPGDIGSGWRRRDT